MQELGRKNHQNVNDVYIFMHCILTLSKERGLYSFKFGVKCFMIESCTIFSGSVNFPFPWKSELLKNYSHAIDQLTVPVYMMRVDSLLLYLLLTCSKTEHWIVEYFRSVLGTYNSSKLAMHVHVEQGTIFSGFGSSEGQWVCIVRKRGANKGESIRNCWD